MNINKINIYFIILFFTLISCSKTDTGRDGKVSIEDDELTSTGIIDFSFTRDDEFPKVNFKNTDSIGLLAYNNKTGEIRKFTLTMKNDKWDPRIRRNELGNGKVTLSAYYPIPHNSIESPNNQTYSIKTDQSGIGYSQSKIFFSKIELKRNEEKVNMNLHNLMYQLEINIESSNQLSDLTIKLRKLTTKSKISLLNGNIEISSDTKKEREDIIPYKVNEGKYKVILIPQSTDYYQKNGLIQATYSRQITQINAPLTIDNKPFKVFKSGNKDIMEINLESNTVKVIPNTEDNDKE